jgi:hypothetical protein
MNRCRNLPTCTFTICSKTDSATRRRGSGRESPSCDIIGARLIDAAPAWQTARWCRCCTGSAYRDISGITSCRHWHNRLFRGGAEPARLFGRWPARSEKLRQLPRQSVGRLCARHRRCDRHGEKRFHSIGHNWPAARIQPRHGIVTIGAHDARWDRMIRRSLPKAEHISNSFPAASLRKGFAPPCWMTRIASTRP